MTRPEREGEDSCSKIFLFLNTMQIMQEYINRVRTNYGKFNLHFSGPSIWNNLDEELKSLSLRSFKQTMNKHYLSTYG